MLSLQPQPQDHLFSHFFLCLSCHTFHPQIIKVTAVFELVSWAFDFTWFVFSYRGDYPSFKLWPLAGSIATAAFTFGLRFAGGQKTEEECRIVDLILKRQGLRGESPEGLPSLLTDSNLALQCKAFVKLMISCLFRKEKEWAKWKMGDLSTRSNLICGRAHSRKMETPQKSEVWIG